VPTRLEDNEEERIVLKAYVKQVREQVKQAREGLKPWPAKARKRRKRR